MPKYIDIKGKVFGALRADKFIGGKYGEWECKCLICNNKYITRGKYLRNGYKTSCNDCSHLKIEPTNTMKVESDNILYDMKDMIVGRVRVISNAGGGSWNCICKCGEKIKVKGFNLREAIKTGRNYSCKHCSYKDKLNNITGKTFGNWYVNNYLGNGYYECICSCEAKTVRAVHGKSLKSGASTSCGCTTRQKIILSRLDKYGDITHNIKGKRTEEQIEASYSVDGLRAFIYNNFKEKPTITELSKALGISTTMTARKIKMFNLEICINYSNHRSSQEKEIYNIISEIYNGEIKYSVRDIINPYELDIYIPEKKLAIEFNGMLWHSTIYKDKHYHQQKTLACAKQGIRLIHIFEYEWNDAETREKIIRLLDSILSKNKKTIYARETEIKQINNSECTDFLDMYHLQGSLISSIRLGCFYKNELVGVMTFGKPRFNNGYEYELHRLCWNSKVKVIGGAEKLFSYFIKNYNPQSIITYSDISKFTGNVYTKLEFKPIQPNPITEPNYIWVSEIGSGIYETISRYQTQKHRLLELGIGTEDQTEDEIMEDLGYLKIYDSGNIKLKWLNNNKN